MKKVWRLPWYVKHTILAVLSIIFVSPAAYSAGKLNNHFSTSYKYDLMGNILTLRREGLLDSGDYGTIDDLTYSYEGNKVVKIDDAADESPSTAEQCTSAMPPMKRRSINTMPTAIC